MPNIYLGLIYYIPLVKFNDDVIKLIEMLLLQKYSILSMALEVRVI